MAIKVYLSGKRRRPPTQGKDYFEVNGKTLGECLGHLASMIQGMNNDLFYGEKNALRSNVQVMLNKEKISSDSLGLDVKEGDEIYLKKKFQ